VNYASLCSGIGGLDLAVEAVFGAEVAWHAEVDKQANQVLAKHWPGTPNYGDITKVPWEDVAPPDLICAGPPCQPVSRSGPRKGELDERFLWPDVLDAVGRLHPGWVVFENPPGALPWLGRIIFCLAQMGYLGTWGVYSAAAVGACHRRERVFVLAADPGSPGVKYFCDLISGPEEPRWGEQGPSHIVTGPVGWADAGGRPVLATFEDGSTEDYGPALRRHRHFVGRPCPKPLDDKGYLRGRFLEWVMMLPEDWLVEATPSAQRRLAGNACCPPQAEMALWGLLGRLMALLAPSGRTGASPEQ
jgi:DNA (cytosine-5)-methyltransferase 1